MPQTDMENQPDTIWQRDISVMLACAGGALLFLSYSLVFALTLSRPLSVTMIDAAINTVPALLLGTLVWLIVDKFVIARPFWLQAAIHLPLALLYAFSWYFLLLTLLGARDGWLSDGFSVLPFRGPAVAWQMFQGVTLYAICALFTYTMRFRQEMIAAHQSANRAETQEYVPRQLLFNVEKEIVSLEFDDVIRISGAGDYAEVVTATKRFLSTTSLAKFEASVPEELFVRAHRSHIVRLDAIERAEPAGNGRLTLHMKNGDTVASSRNGTRTIRQMSL